ncbi:ABC transporter ATP-binding protein [Paenibacillus kobensis]|uniref:ABC transporter ATP-binding protein n=1 Tax=Paenibacillus kobensis TaxID=59841 RepID=UPI000FD7459A|nr:ABC transporter ATP-binding protein [Paenibacillus kobensis]
MRISSSLRRLFSYTKRYRLLYAGLLFCMLVGIGIELATAQYLNRMTSIAAAGEMSKLGMMLAAGAVLLVLTALFHYSDTYLKTAVSSRIRSDLRTDTMNVIVRLTGKELERTHSGELTARLTSDNGAIGDLFGHSLLSLIRNPLLAVASFIFLLNIYWPLALICLLIGPTTVLVGIVFGGSLHRNAMKLQERMASKQTFLQDVLSTSLVFKTFGLERKLFSIYRDKSKEVMGAELAGGRLNAAVAGVASGVGLMSFVVAFVCGAYFVADGKMAIGGLIAFIQLLNHLTWPFTGLASTWGSVQQSVGAADRIFELIDRPVESDSIDQRKGASPAFRQLELDRVSFSYGGDTSGGSGSLRDVTLTIKEGQRIGIVGPSGSGKSTLLKLLLGLQQAQAGEIRMNGMDVRELDVHQLRAYYALVPQETRLYAGTIRDNLLHGNPDATEQQLVDAIQAANAHDFIMKLPLGIDNEVGEHGAGLSGGQKQRVAIARALLRDAPILLLDEATSALDSESEQEILSSLDLASAGKTTITIAHRLYTVRDADFIVVMDNGQIQAVGSHETLIGQSSLYRRMYNSQSISESAEEEIA